VVREEPVDRLPITNHQLTNLPTYQSTNLLRLSRATLLAMLFFSPWVLEWPITVQGLDCSEVKLRLADGLALISVVAVSLKKKKGRERLRQSPLKVYALTLSALVVFAASSMLWAASGGTALAFTIRLAWWMAIAVRVACDGVPPRQIAVVLLSGLLLQAAIGIVQFGAQHQVGLNILGELPLDLTYPAISVVSAGGPPLIRLYGLSGHPNVIGGFAAIALLLGLGLLRERRAKWWAAWLIGLTALLLTFSRSAALGLLIGLAAISLMRRPNRQRAIGLIVSGGSVIGIFALLFAPFLIARVSGEVAIEQVSIDERVEQTALAWQLFSDHPLTGVGFGNFTQYNPPATAGAPAQRAHNVPLLIASELGLPGLLLWVVSVAAVMSAGIRSGREKTAVWPSVMISALIAILVISLFDYYWWTSSQGVYVWATICGALLAQAAMRPPRIGRAAIDTTR
jgi:hypothetical protein